MKSSMPKAGSVHWIYYPKSDGAPEQLRKVPGVLDYHRSAIDSSTKNLSSNEVLRIVGGSLTDLGFSVEMGSAKFQTLRFLTFLLEQKALAE